MTREAARGVFAGLETGVTERDVAHELEARLAREGVRTWLHFPFVWFGARSGFVGMSKPWDFLPTRRRLRDNEVVCFDLAPVVDGYAADHGGSCMHGSSAEYDRMLAFDESLRERIVAIISRGATGGDLVRATNAAIVSAGYEVRHVAYPFGILGHRLERVRSWDRFAVGRPFQLPTLGLHARQMIRGVNPLLNERDRQPLEGVWAIQPHVGNGRFGLKFEDLLWVHRDGAAWLGEPS